MSSARFVAAFNARSTDDLGALLAADTATELVGASVPPEVGPDAIRAGSFTHMLGEKPPLLAERIDDETVWLTHGPSGPVDVIIALTIRDGTITRLRYHTLWCDRAFVEASAAAAGRSVATPGGSEEP